MCNTCFCRILHHFTPEIEIGSYIHFYNEERIHTSIGMMSPCEAEAALLEPVVKILD